MHTPGRLIIRTYAPLRRWLVIGGSTVLGALLLYVAFESGRGSAGSAGREALALRGSLEQRVDALEATNRELRLKLAGQETAQTGQSRERAELARTIGELQAQVARQAQDLAFYRGLAGDAAAAPPVRVQQFRVAALGTPGRYALKLILGRPVRPEDIVTGTLALTVEGTQNDQPVVLDLAALTEGQMRELRFSYRYLQTFDQPLTLPPGFEPERSTLEIRVARKGVEPVRQIFLWSLESS